MANFLADFQQAFPQIEFKENEPLARYTTVKIGGPAEVFCEIKTSEQLAEVIQLCQKQNVPYTVLGWGANTLIADRGLPGLTIRFSAMNWAVLDENTAEAVQPHITSDIRWAAVEAETYGSFTDLNYDESSSPQVRVKIDAGMPLPILIQQTLNAGITGLQWFSRIPATLGGAIYNNIHGGTRFIDEVVESVEVIDKNGERKTVQNDELEFGYDFSRFHKSGETILTATLKLFKGDVERAKKVVQEWASRKKVQPQQSLGCVWQNISAEDQQKHNFPTPSVGYIVDQILHKKGVQIGGAKISEKHAAFIENAGNATAQEFLELMKMMVTETRDTLGIQLKPEIFFKGFTEDELGFLKN